MFIYEGRHPAVTARHRAHRASGRGDGRGGAA
jgi:hypothetical protein